jgi:ATP-dependent RNA circularization protein (DNA/RNA ligase family)
MQTTKPLGRKAYGSIPHLPGSRLGPGDHSCSSGQAKIATVKPRDGKDTIHVQEKLDGSCTAVAKINDEIIALGRAGYTAFSSPYEQHRLFAQWVQDHWSNFYVMLNEGERAVGEWLAQAHSTKYDFSNNFPSVNKSPWVLFDIMTGTTRKTVEEVTKLAGYGHFATPPLLFTGKTPVSIEQAMEALDTYGFYGALEPVEGVVWRVEREGKVDFLVKYVRPGKIDGCYLGNQTGRGPVWNWRPERERT